MRSGRLGGFPAQWFPDDGNAPSRPHLKNNPPKGVVSGSPTRGDLNPEAIASALR